MSGVEGEDDLLVWQAEQQRRQQRIVIPPVVHTQHILTTHNAHRGR
jgi:hypothetical protein